MAIHQANRDYKNSTFIMVPLLSLLLVVLGYIFTEIVDTLWFKPWFLSIAIFYWVLFLPRSVPLWFTLVLGLLEDGLAGTPFGLYGLGVLCIHYLAIKQRQSLVYSPFPMVVTGFAINLFMVMVLLNFIMWVIGLPVSWWSLLGWLFTSVLFLPIALAFEALRFKMMKE